MSSKSLKATFSKINPTLFEKQISYQRYKAFFQQQRSKKYKKNWASNLKPKTNSQQALQHFDVFYGKFYGKLWPSIRISLLSQQKYCALVNNFDKQLANESKTILQELGATNFTAVSSEVIEKFNQIEKQSTHNTVQATDNFVHETVEQPETSTFTNSLYDRDDKTLMFSDATDPVDEKNTCLYDFVPTTKVYTEKEQLQIDIANQNTFEDHDIPTHFITEGIPEIPETLKAFCYERGNIDTFPSPRNSNWVNKLGYFLMDAASILPVIALDIQKEDKVLDLCSAPGGKMLTMLQYPNTGTLICNDSSKSRLERLSRILTSYGNESMIDRVTVHVGSGLNFTDPQYEKVLVDVPCTNDRHSVLVDDNNIFKPGRLQERLQLPNLQKDLLVSGIKSCVPGGYIVYSTCSLSPGQNDGVVQAALEDIWKETNIDVNIIDLGYISKLFNKTFNFFNGCKFGQLILPNLTANFGPMYICKLKRIT